MEQLLDFSMSFGIKLVLSYRVAGPCCHTLEKQHFAVGVGEDEAAFVHLSYLCQRTMSYCPTVFNKL